MLSHFESAVDLGVAAITAVNKYASKHDKLCRNMDYLMLLRCVCVSPLVLCRYNRLDYLYLNAGIMPNPQFDLTAFFKGLFSRYLGSSLQYPNLVSALHVSPWPHF